MKKRILNLVLAACVLGITPAIAQVAMHLPGEAHAPDIAPQPPTADYRGGGPTIVWSEDFGAGFPAGWTLQNASGLCPWKWNLHGSHGFWNGTSGATYGDTIASTTAANGFLIADNDSANHFNFGQPSGTTYQYINTYFTTPAIDLSAHANVKLEFEQFFRYNNAITLDVMVSSDSLNWTTWDAKGTVVPNATSTNIDLVSINISAVAGGQSTVYVKIGWDARVYFWMIDDMRIVEAPSNDLKLNDVNYSEWFFDTAPDFGALEYSIYPTTQLRPFGFKGEFTNEGYLTQTNVMLDIDVSDLGGSVHADQSSIASSAPLTGDSIYLTTWTPPAMISDYTVTFTLSADSVDATSDNNELTRNFSVSQYDFARDRNSLTGRYDNQGDAYNLGNWYHVVNDQMLYGIDVAIDDDTPVGVVITGTLWDVDRNVIETTADHNVLSSDLNATGGNTFTTLAFNGPIDLLGGNDFFVSVDHYGGTDNLWTGISGVSLPQTSLIYDDPVATWFYLTATPMVRMNFDPSVGINSAELANGVGLGQNMPNPATESTVIAFEVTTSATATLDLFDISGKLIERRHLGTRSAGVHRIEMDTRALPDGIYSYTLRANNTQLTRRMTVIH
mgnify:CR=1 FL=1